MSYDLPLALRALARTGRGELRDHIADFHRMNGLLASCVDTVQDEISARYCRRLQSLDRLFTGDDALFTSYGIRVARGMAWFNCDRLTDPQATAGAMGSISRSTAAFSPSSARRTTGGAASPSESCGPWSPPGGGGRHRAPRWEATCGPSELRSTGR